MSNRLETSLSISRRSRLMRPSLRFRGKGRLRGVGGFRGIRGLVVGVSPTPETNPNATKTKAPPTTPSKSSPKSTNETQDLTSNTINTKPFTKTQATKSEKAWIRCSKCRISDHLTGTWSNSIIYHNYSNAFTKAKIISFHLHVCNLFIRYCDVINYYLNLCCLSLFEFWLIAVST